MLCYYYWKQKKKKYAMKSASVSLRAIPHYLGRIIAGPEER